jgi:putative flippase GtrA
MIASRPFRAAEVMVLLIANLAATAVRFVLYRHWVFRRKTPPGMSQPAATAAG